MASFENERWSVDLHPVTGELRVISASGPVALVAVGPGEHENASLIAAAPEMRAILRTTRGNIASLGPAGALSDVYVPYREWLARVDAVLALTEPRP